MSNNAPIHSCILELPYPVVKTGGTNSQYGKLLFQDYAGMFGEMTAITKYFYQHTIIKKENAELANSLECISMVEMKHLEILGELIHKFGEDPRFMGMNGRKWSYWNGGYVSYEKNIRGFLKANIEGEEIAIREYGMRIKQIDDPQVRKILERIILDEKHHIKIFDKYLIQYS